MTCKEYINNIPLRIFRDIEMRPTGHWFVVYQSLQVFLYPELLLRVSMKWFKHMTDSLNDPFIQALLDRFSHAGYVAYFGLIEVIAKENGNNITGDLAISPEFLRRKLRISQAKLQQIFGFCQAFAKLLVDFQKEKWIFSFPKIAEIKDNYTKDLQGTGKKPSKQQDAEKEVYKEIYKEKKLHLEFVYLLKDEYEKLIQQFGEERTQDFLQRLNDYIGSTGKKYKSHYYTILNWSRKDAKEHPETPPEDLPRGMDKYREVLKKQGQAQ